MKAKGQESWSYSLSGVSSGFVTIRARAVDWAGNITESTENVSFYMNVQSPLILMAGFERSHLWQNQESTVTFGMFVSDPFGINYVENIDIYLDGEFIGTSLELKSISSGIAYYQAQMPLEFAQSERKRYSFIAWDKYENFSHVWPYLCVRP